MPSEPSADATVQQLFDLTGRVALVTGAGGYLGTAMAGALAEAGATVVAGSRDTQRAEDAARALPNAARHHGVALDHMDADSCRAGFQAAVERAGRVDMLINNGHERNGKDLTDVTFEQFTRELQNAAGYFELSRLLRDHAVERGAPASIVMIGSMYGVVGSYPDAYEGIGPASPVSYQTLKGGLVQMTRHLAVYWANDGVRVNCLSPGPFPPEQVPEALKQRLRRKSPMGRMGAPQEVKGAALYLASDASSYVTGQNLLVDGGWTAW